MFMPFLWLRYAVFAALLLGALLMSPLARAEEFPTRSKHTAGAIPATTGNAAQPVRASEAGVVCGQTITADTTLVADLSCPPEAELGIVIGASNITLDLGGHVLSGYAPVGKVNRGIVALNVSGVTIKNGTVAEFSEGIDFFSSHGITLENLSVRNLRITDPDHFITGIGIADSSAVVVKDSQFEFAPPVFHKTGVGFAASDVTVSNIVVRGGGVGVDFGYAYNCDPERRSNGQVLNSRFLDSLGGVYVNCSASARIAGNEIDCPSAPEHCEGIRSYGPYAGAVSGLRVEGNTIRNVIWGINLEGVVQSGVTNNMVTASRGWGIMLRQTQGEDGAPISYPFGNTVSGNVVWGNGLDLYDDGTGQGNLWEDNICATKEGDAIPTCGPLSIVTNPSDQSVVAGQTASFSAVATQAGWQQDFAPTVQWQASADGGSTWASVTGATSPTYSFNASIADNGKQYRAVFSDGSATATTTAATLTVGLSSSGPAVTSHPSNQTVIDGGIATLTAGATGIPTPGIQWQTSEDDGATWVDLVTRANASTYSLNAAVTDSGRFYRAVFANDVGSAMTNPARLTVIPREAATEDLILTGGGAASVRTAGGSGPIRAGYAVGTITKGTPPYGTAVFVYTQNGVVVSEASVPVSPPTVRARFFVDTRTQVSDGIGQGTLDIFTGFAAVNPNKSGAKLDLKLRDSTGTTLAQGSIRLAPGEHISKFLDQLAPDFVLPPGFVDNGLGSLEIASDQPVSVLALRLTINQRGDLLLTSTPLADLTKAASGEELAFSQIADGGGYQTTLVLMNTSNAVESGVVRFYGNTGTPLLVRMVNAGGADSNLSYSIPPGGLLRLVIDGTPSDVNVGWARLIPDAGTSAPVSAATFNFTQLGTMVTETGVPATTGTTHARIYVDKSGSHDTGLAVANPGNTNLRITAKAYQTDGVTPAGNGPGTLDLAPYGHDARFAGQLIAGLPDGFTGVLDLSSAAPFSALTLRSLMNGRGDFLITVFPVADVNQPPPAPLIFPQIADGGGYQTQIVLLDTSGAASAVTVSYFGDDGSFIPVVQGGSEAQTLKQNMP
jgi:hypothetical protein